VTALLTAPRRGWRSLSSRQRGVIAILGPIGLYLLAYVLPGLGATVARRAPVGIVLVGVFTGAVTALLAIGLILIYRANRFINFAYGSMGSLVGVIAIGLHLQHGWPFFLVLPLGVAAGGLVGIAVEYLVIRRFYNSSRLVLTVASIGLAQLLGYFELRGAQAIKFLALEGGFKVPISFQFNVGVRQMAGDEVLIILVVPFVIAFLAWFLLRTDAGVAVRGAAENADRALLYGIPVRRLSTIVWVIAGSMATLTFILKAPFSGVTPGIANGPAVLLPALAAAVVARMESLPVAFGAGVGLGITEQLVLWNYPRRPALIDVIFLAVILIALLGQRGRLSRAQESGTSSWSSTGVVKPIPIELRHLPEVKWPKRVLLAVAVAAFVFIPLGWSASNQYTAAVAIVWAMVGVSLVVLTGWGGHISLGQFAVVGIGAFTAGNLLIRYNLDFFLVVIIAGLAGAAVSLLVGLPALRIRGLFLAVTTLALAIAVNSYLLNTAYFPKLVPNGVERPLLLERFDLNDNYTMYVVCLVFLGLSVLAAAGVRKARNGRVVIATRDNQRAADSASVPTTNVKLSAFVLAGVITGVAGVMHMLLLSSLQVGSYTPDQSLAVFSYAVIGGLGSLSGAISGVLFFQWLGTVQALGQLRLAVAGAGLLFILYFLPGGIWQLVLMGRDNLLRRIADRRGILVPSLVADKRVEEGDDEPPKELSLLEDALA
jgi:branched-chain amino acid transport system permease protein